MKRKLIIIGLAALFAAGCLSSASKINAVSLGMNKAQVLKIMGTPASVTADQNAEYLNYTLLESRTLGVQPTSYEIKLVHGQVESYGHAGRPAASHPVPIK